MRGYDGSDPTAHRTVDEVRRQLHALIDDIDHPLILETLLALGTYAQYCRSHRCLGCGLSMAGVLGWLWLS